MSSLPLFGFDGQEQRAAGSPGWAVAQLVGEHGRDLRRPEELVLEVDEPLGRPEARAGTTRGSGSRRAGRRRRCAPGSCARPARSTLARLARCGATGGSVSPVTSCQRIRKCSATSATAGPSIRAHTSCQPTPARAGWSLVSKRSPVSDVRSIPPTNATRSSITIVFSWWQCSGRSFASSAHWIFVCSISRSRIARTSPRDGPEERQRRARPDEHAHVDPLGELGQQVAQDRAARRSRVRCEVGREVPAGQMHVRLRARAARPRSPGAPLRRRSVPRPRCPARRRVALGPAAGRRVERALPADPPQPAPVMAADLLRDLVAEPALGRESALDGRQASDRSRRQILR